MAQDRLPSIPKDFDVEVNAEVMGVVRALKGALTVESMSSAPEFTVRSSGLAVNFKYSRADWLEHGFPEAVTFGFISDKDPNIKRGYVMAGLTRFDVTPKGIKIDAAQTVYTTDMATDLKFNPRPALATIAPGATTLSWGNSSTVRRPR